MPKVIEKILLYVESTQEAITAAQYAISLAKMLNCKLYAIYCIDTKSLGDLLKARIFVAQEESEYKREIEENGKRYLNHIQKLAQEQQVNVEIILARGEVHREVINKARDLKVDLLIMGELEELTSRKDMFYDEAERIFRESSCSILVVKETAKH